MCNCINIKTGSYDNQVTVISPEWSTKDYICIDYCILDEVRSLWSLGIRTTGCCCGHNSQIPYIGVIDEDINKMIIMGYKISPNNLYPKRKDSFYPKTLDI